MTESRQWHDEDAYWDMVASWMFHEERWEQAEDEAGQLVERLGLEGGSAVLDLCCGPGRHSIALARRGLVVTGVDRSGQYVEAATRWAKREHLPAEFVVADMREFVRRGAFDAAVCTITSFGYFPDAADDRKVLRHLYESLREGGRLLVDVEGREVAVRQFRPRNWEQRHGAILLQEYLPSDDWSQMDIRWIVLEGPGRREFTVSHRLYSAAELRRELLDAGFQKVALFGGLDGSAYDHNARRLVALATR